MIWQILSNQSLCGDDLLPWKLWLQPPFSLMGGLVYYYAYFNLYRYRVIIHNFNVSLHYSL